MRFGNGGQCFFIIFFSIKIRRPHRTKKLEYYVLETLRVVSSLCTLSGHSFPSLVRFSWKCSFNWRGEWRRRRRKKLFFLFSLMNNGNKHNNVIEEWSIQLTSCVMVFVSRWSKISVHTHTQPQTNVCGTKTLKNGDWENGKRWRKKKKAAKKGDEADKKEFRFDWV